ncbi:MAG: hypothetical protein ACRC1M_06600 [Methanobacteriaceae archaeon]
MNNIKISNTKMSKIASILILIILAILIIGIVSIGVVNASNDTSMSKSTGISTSTSKIIKTNSSNVTIFKNITNSNSETYTPKYGISYFDKTVGGNVLKNSKVSKNILNTALSKKIVAMVKNGSVILKFGNGNGPKLLICGGIHGDENTANIATLRLIEPIKNKRINGTIYIIPFLIPKDTEKNSRKWYYTTKKIYVDPNRVAHITGSPGNKLVKFAKENSIKYIMDVHNGERLSSYKRGFIFANKYPTTKIESKWLNYIKKYVNPTITYNVPENGMIRNQARINGISTITFEVERDNGYVSNWAKVEYKMIICGLKYFKLI